MRFHRPLVIISAMALLLLLSMETCLASKRVALVIGNGSYQAAPLDNPVNDATDIAALLGSLGFDVIKRINVNKKQMLESISSFSRKLDKSEIGLFYYAGHGMQINGRNYLVPVNVNVEVESDVEFEAVDAGRLISRMKTNSDRLNVVILDACRNNPFARSFRSSSQGLARMDAPRGTIIAYATGPGAVAADGLGRNGIFTKHLLDAMQQPDLDIQEVFNVAGMRVMKETEDRQIPWTSNTPIPRYYLVSGFFLVEQLPGTTTTNTTSGSLKILSEPAGATVSIDGKTMQETPVLLQNLQQGNIQLRVEKNGFIAEEKQVAIKAGRQVSISFVLSKAAGSGRLTISPEPTDALVRMVNKGSQYRSGMELAPGAYDIEVSRDGYESVIRKVVLEPGEELEVEIVLASKAFKAAPHPGKPYTDSATGMEFVWVEPGCFQMGDTFGHGEEDEQPVHEVCLDGYHIGKHEVTQGEYDRVMSNDPPRLKKDNRYPVKMVSWDDAQAFIKKLNQPGNAAYRLPTEAEWEYAARSGGKKENYSGGNDPEPVAWHAGAIYGVKSNKRREGVHQVGLKKPNGLGIFDMSGNVWEWCQDWYLSDYYSKSPRLNPTGPSLGWGRVLRGGGHSSNQMTVRASGRIENRQGNRNHYSGFRLVLTGQR